MAVPAKWRDELHRAARPELDLFLASRGLPGLPRRVFDMLIAYEPMPADADPVTWLAEVKEGAARVVSELAPDHAGPEGGETAAVEEAALVDDRRWDTLAQILAIEAAHNPFVGNWREQHLPNRKLVRAKAATAFREGLDPQARGSLDGLAASLVEWHGWWDTDEAALFVLTGAVPAGRRVRTRIVVRPRVGASRVVIEVDPRASPQAVADSYRKARAPETLEPLHLPADVARRHRLNGARPHPITDKNAELALHLARNRQGSWGERREGWNQAWSATQADWFYEADSAFARDAGRAWAQVVGETFAHKQPAVRIPV